ncbi:propionate kinase [Acrasis kona]|uniref:Propionate kinase n=1 Tax=Acrasis kona TaxID=1008807 RepID=A0AAW2YPS5_9EUKA
MNRFNIPSLSDVTFDQTVPGTELNGVPISKKILVEGNGDCPNEGSNVKYVHQGYYVIEDQDTHERTTVVLDNNALGSNPQEERLKNNNAMFKLCLHSMKAGEKSVFLIPSRFRLGGDVDINFGGNTLIRAGSHTYYWFYCTEVLRNRLKPDNLAQRLEYANLEKCDGTNSYKSGDLKKALYYYQRAKTLLSGKDVNPIIENNPDCKHSIIKLKVPVVTNLVKTLDAKRDYLKAMREAETLLEEIQEHLLAREFVMDDSDKRLMLYGAEMLYLKAKLYRLLPQDQTKDEEEQDMIVMHTANGKELKASRNNLEQCITLLDMDLLKILPQELKVTARIIKEKALVDLKKTNDRIQSNILAQETKSRS